MSEDGNKYRYNVDQKINLVIAISTFVLAFIAFIGLIFALTKFKISSAAMILFAILIGMALVSWMIVRWIKNE